MSCNRCGSTSCVSGYCSSCSGSSTPYYSQADTCAEDHCEKIYCNKFSFAVCAENSWNVPLCGQTSILSVPGVVGASVGSYLWHTSYGYFEIVSVNSDRGELGIVNNCTTGNASPGTQIPKCTCFVVTVPPSDNASQTGVCLVVDFTAPAVGDCIDITLTTTEGLAASDTVSIGSGFYFVDEVKPDNIITICNEGDGITPGTPVIALDANGRYQYCLSVISSNPCNRDPESPAVPLACGENGITVPIEGSTPGWVLTLVDGTTKEAEYEPLGASGACTTLTAPFDFTIAVDSYTNIAVADSSVFQVGDGVQFNGYTTDVLVITNIPDGLHIDGTFEVVPGFSVTIPTGTRLCLRSCCEDINIRIDTQGIATDTATAFTPTTVSAPGTTSGNVLSVGPYTNPSGATVQYIATCEFIWAGLFIIDDITDDIAVNVAYRPYYATVTGAIGTTANPAPVLDATGPIGDSLDTETGSIATWTDWNYGQSHSVQLSGSIAPGDELRVSAQAKLEVVNVASGDVYISTLQAKITTIRITV